MPELRGHEYEVERRPNESPGGYAYEFVLVVDGEDVKTASELEAAGWAGPEDGGFNWTKNLRNYAKGYIRGVEA